MKAAFLYDLLPIPTKKLPTFGEFFYWCRLGDSNARPTHYECVALPTELNRHNKAIDRTLCFILQALFSNFAALLLKIFIPPVRHRRDEPPLAGTEFQYPLR